MVTPAPLARYGVAASPPGGEVGPATSPPGGEVAPAATSPPRGEVAPRWDLFEFHRGLDASGLPPMVQLVLSKAMFVPSRGGDGFADSRDLSEPALARRCGTKSQATIQRALRAAEAAGWLTRIRRGPGKRSAYLLHMPTPVDSAPNLTRDGLGTDQNLTRDGLGTSPVASEGFTRDGLASYPLLTEIPSIDQSVRARVRQACPDLQPDDDDLSTLIANLETRQPNPVRNVVAYLQTCPPADIRRLLAEGKTQVRKGPASAPAAPAEPLGECEHGHDAGTNPATGTPRCPVARRAGAPACAAIPQAAVPLSRSVPFVASLDGRDRTPPLGAAEALSGPICAGAGA